MNQRRQRVEAQAAKQTGAGVRHYLHFCRRAQLGGDVAPARGKMIQQVKLWLQDAPQAYCYKGVHKKAISTGSMKTYLSHVDTWWTKRKQEPKGSITRHPEVKLQMRILEGDFKCADKQVHGLTFEHLQAIVAGCRALPKSIGPLLEAAFTTAWFGLLRPSEYMLTPQHPEFDRARHLRAGDIEFRLEGKRLELGSNTQPDAMRLNVKQSKTDSTRLGANLTIGATGKDVCAVKATWAFMNLHKPPRDGPAFSTIGPIRYGSMLKALRSLIPTQPQLYGLHSFRVGGAQAMALAGIPLLTIMAHGRWKTSESVTRYIETPEGVANEMVPHMTATSRQRAHVTQRTARWNWHTQPEGELVLPLFPNQREQ